MSRLPSLLRKLAVWAVAIVVIAYGALVGAAWAMQDDILYHPSTTVVAPSLPGVTSERIKTDDGQTLVSWYSPAAAGCPTILFFDGNGGNPQMQGGRWSRIQAHGLGFLGLYYRGYSGSTGHPSEKGFHHDAEAGFAWLTAKGISPANIVVHGFSIGSGPATKIAANHPVGALILEAPYYSMASLLQDKAPFLPVGLVLRSTFHSDIWIKQVHAPLLVVHGTADGLIPQAHGRRLFDAANEPKQFVSMPGSDHATLVRDGLYDHVWPFLAKYWKGDASQPPCTKLQEAASTAEHA